MDKIETQTKTIEQRYHNFYCDVCGKYLGTSAECEDGWYQTLGGFGLKWHTPAGWYYTEKCLCDECREKYLSEVYAGLEQLGFKKEN